jgi:hypothetical protein
LAYEIEQTWLAIEREDAAFLSVLGLICNVLDRDEPPAPSSTCRECNR